VRVGVEHMRGLFFGPDMYWGRPGGVTLMVGLLSRCHGYDAHAAAVVVVTMAVFFLRGLGDGGRRAAVASINIVRIASDSRARLRWGIAQRFPNALQRRKGVQRKPHSAQKRTTKTRRVEPQPPTVPQRKWHPLGNLVKADDRSRQAGGW